MFATYDRDNDIVYFYDEYTATERTPQEHVTALSKQCPGFRPQFIWALQDWVIEKVKAGKYRGVKLYKDLVKTVKPPIEFMVESIKRKKISAEVKNLRLQLLEGLGCDAYASWFEPLKICLEGGIAVFKVSNEFAKVKVEEKYGQDLRQLCDGFGLRSEIVVDG